MTRPAFIVEGHLEQRVIAQVCPNRPVRRINCNGDSVAIERMCDFIETHIRSFGNRNYPIIILFDREKRVETSDEISDRVVSILGERGLCDHDIRVFVADREVEDWYLGDIEGICRHYNIAVPASIGTGKSGLAMAIRSAVDYHETTIGVELFGVISKTMVAERCPQFSRMMRLAAEIDCDAFRQGQLG